MSLGAFSPLAAPALSAATPGGALARAACSRGSRAGGSSSHDLRSRVDALGAQLRRQAATGGRGPRLRPPRGVRRRRRARGERRRRRGRLVRRAGPVRARSRSATASTWTAASGAPRTSTWRGPGRGDRVLCLVPTAAMGTGPSLAMRGLATGWRLATSVEAAAARRRGASVEIVAPDTGAAAPWAPTS